MSTIERSAYISECGTYRYSLTRGWDATLPPLVWMMLNPSTADAEVDDPTIRRVVGFTQRPGCYGAAIVVNLYALRPPKPVRLATDPVGPLNDVILKSYGATWDVMAAWGAHAPLRAAQVLMGPLRGRHLFCLGKTKDGFPRHPLYVKADQRFEVFR